MGLKMPTPFKHPKTGVYQFRRRVPKDLRPIVGHKFIQRTLETKDVREAKRRFSEVSVEIEREWARLRRQLRKEAGYPPPLPEGPEHLKRWQMYGLAGEFARWFVRKQRDEPKERSAEDWEADVERDQRWRNPGGKRPPGIVGLYVTSVKQFLAERGVAVLDEDLWELTKAVSKAPALRPRRRWSGWPRTTSPKTRA